jgi:hypothetical protein
MQLPVSSSKYPRVYRLAPGWAVGMLVFGAVAVGGSAFGIWRLCIQEYSRNPAGAIFLAVVFAAFALLGVWALWSVFKSRVVLYADRIESFGITGIKSLRRDQVLGRRLAKGRNSPGTLVLVPRNSQRPLMIGLCFRRDRVFDDWMSTFTDLDAQDLRASIEEITGGPESGSPRAELMQGLARGKRLARHLNLIMLIAAGWGWFYPQPYPLAVFVLALLPWVAVAIVAKSGGLFRIDERKNDAHPNVAPLFILPGFVLALRVLSDIHVWAWQPALYLSAAIAFVLWLAAAKADAALRVRRASLILMLLLCLGYGYGVGMEANAMLDRSPATIYAAAVRSKRVSSGRSTSYKLDLAPWGPGPTQEAGDVSVSRRLYESVKRGDSVCAALRPGAMGVSWYVVSRCR